MYHYILFDLDGTLTDPKQGITGCVQYALRRLGMEAPDADALEPFIGPPLLDSFQEFCGFDEEKGLQAVAYYRERYAASGWFENEAYPGIVEMLARLQEAGCHLAVASSKPEVFVEKILVHFGMRPYFDVVVGSGLDGSRARKEEVVEVGVFGAGQFIPCEELSAGMVGYITASIKNVKDTEVGDTVTDDACPCQAPLPGYKKVQSMVYCGFYPADGAKYPDLRDALEKLQLNDAALQYEPETSIALGFGFRCGFLGLLHLEVIQERLEREYNLDLVATAPGVVYKVFKTNGEMIELTNPSNLPDPSVIEHMEEPVVSAEIMVTSEFIGSIMELCQERRGRYLGMEYIEASRAVLRYDLPLNEIIYDFFDALKSRSKGYASFDYDIKGYEESKLVKLDILINKEEVDALSFIVHADSAYERGRRMCEKLKEEIPRHLFEIPIQAAIGGKVIARETVKAMRKDVLAKCYGGDITRKKKLLEKQKEGKKRMRQIGNVEIPQKAFLSVLKLDDD